MKKRKIKKKNVLNPLINSSDMFLYGPIQEVLSYMNPLDVYFKIKNTCSGLNKAGRFFIENKMFNLSYKDIEKLKNITKKNKRAVDAEFLDICFSVIIKQNNNNKIDVNDYIPGLDYETQNSQKIKDLLHLNLMLKYYRNFKKIISKEVDNNLSNYTNYTRELVEEYFFSSDVFKESFSVFLLSLFERAYNRKDVINSSLTTIIFNVINSSVMQNMDVKNRLCVITDYIEHTNISVDIRIDYSIKRKLSKVFYMSKERINFYLSRISNHVDDDAFIIAKLASKNKKKFEFTGILDKVRLKKRKQELVDYCLDNEYIETSIFILKNVDFCDTYSKKVIKKIIKIDTLTYGSKSNILTYMISKGCFGKELFSSISMFDYAIKHACDRNMIYFINGFDFLKYPENYKKYPLSTKKYIYSIIGNILKNNRKNIQKFSVKWEKVVENLIISKGNTGTLVREIIMLKDVDGELFIRDFMYMKNLFYRYAIENKDSNLKEFLYPHVMKDIIPENYIM